MEKDISVWAALQLDILNWLSDPGLPPPSQQSQHKQATTPSASPSPDDDEEGEEGEGGPSNADGGAGGGRGGGGGGGGGGGVAVNPDAIDPNDQILTLDLQIGTAPLFLAAWPDAATPAGFVMETAAVSMTQFSTRIDDGHIPRCSGAPLWVRSERFRVGLRSRHKSNHATIARHHRAAIAPLSHHHYATIAPPSRHHHRTCP